MIRPEQPEAVQRHNFVIALALAVLSLSPNEARSEIERPATALATDPLEIEWAERLWNPAASGDDFILPMPCGGAMAFRRISTVLPGNWLTDERVRLGSPQAESSFSHYLTFDHIAGSLTEDEDPATRHFYIGKYEVTADQFDAVQADECPTATMAGRLPITDISWFDAVAFTRAYTEWLLQNVADHLPDEGGSPAFLRLPTEAEWEFAARGGTAVTENEFLDPLFPMDGDINDYAWFQGTRSCQGDLQLVGTKRPNPLGIHDIIGNVEEFVLEPFRMVRAGRRHGQIGGMVVRGGSCMTDRAMLSAAHRTEHSYFNDRTRMASAPPMSGLRVVISAPIQVSHARIADLRSDWRSVSDTSGADLGVDDAGAAEQLEAMAARTTDMAAESLMEQVASVIRRQSSERADIERRAVRAAIRSGALLIRQYRDEARRLENIEMVVDIRISAGSSDEEIEEVENARDSIEERIRITESVYTSLMTQTASDYSENLIEEEASVVSENFHSVGAPSVAVFSNFFAQQVIEWKNAGGDMDEFFEAIKE